MATPAPTPATGTVPAGASAGIAVATPAAAGAGAAAAAGAGGASPSLDTLKSNCITPGAIRDRFTFGRLLGRGAFSSVKAATDKATGEDVAVKIINRRQIHDPRQHAIVLNEIAIMKRISLLKHPNLVRLVAAYEDTEHLYIVLSLCKGGELFDDIVARGKYSERDAAGVTVKLLSALKALHTASIIHRDMKPENCLLDVPGAGANIVITDFGLAQALDGDDVHNSLVGTPGYVAPEVLTGRLYTPACDVWAVGVMLYILLVGYPPFYAETNKEMFQQIKAGSFAFHDDTWCDISAAAKDLVARMLTVSTEKRITVDAALAHPFLVELQSDTPLEEAAAALKTFNAKRKFRVAAMACVWGARMQRASELQKLASFTEFSVTEVETLQRKFREAAGAGKQAVNHSQFVDIMTTLGFGDLPLHRMFELFDVDGDDELDYREFLCGLVTLRRTGEEALEMCFSIYDEDDNGFITASELASVLGVVTGTDEAAELAKADRLSALFASLDTNSDGKLSYPEFKAGIHKNPALLGAFNRRIVTDSGSGSGSGSGSRSGSRAAAAGGSDVEASRGEKRPRPEVLGSGDGVGVGAPKP